MIWSDLAHGGCNSLILHACSQSIILLNVTIVQTDLPCLHSCHVAAEFTYPRLAPPPPFPLLAAQQVLHAIL